MSAENATPKVWVACLASYNAGILHGAWIDATDEAELEEGRAAVLASSPIPGAEESAIHDYDEFPRNVVRHLGEFSGDAEVAAFGAFIAEHGAVGCSWLESVDNLECLDRDRLSETFTDAYCGDYETEADYAYDRMTDTGAMREVPEWLESHIDWESVAEEMFQHGTLVLVDGHVFDESAAG